MNFKRELIVFICFMTVVFLMLFTLWIFSPSSLDSTYQASIDSAHEEILLINESHERESKSKVLLSEAYEELICELETKRVESLENLKDEREVAVRELTSSLSKSKPLTAERIEKVYGFEYIK